MSIHKDYQMKIFSRRAWLSDGWCNNVRITIDGTGHIATVEKNVQAQPADTRIDTLIPALANLHSHSFQRAMAGMTEYKAAGQDSFWTWRTLVYQFLEHLTPEHIQAIAGLVFMEMLEAGYASVGEFHYVHHQSGGTHYDNQAELSLRILKAAKDTGIGLTHLPVLYTYGGAEQKALRGGQLRFGHAVDEFIRLIDALEPAMRDARADTRLGIAPHSLRATAPDQLKEVVSHFSGKPIHIHIAEQPKEVQVITSWLGARPVEWLLSNHAVDTKWCLIHATHMTKEETVHMARSGAVAGLCPVTEANLGDGPFNGPQYLAEHGAFGVGSDSNIRISLTEEMRMLEYSQRLRDLNRNVLVNTEGSVGQTLYLGAAAGGAQALDRKAGEIREGLLADLTAIDSAHCHLYALNEAQLFDGLCFSADDTVVTDVWSAGHHVVADRRHKSREEIVASFKKAMNALKDRLST
jgi:formiminoglutamate deiminase